MNVHVVEQVERRLEGRIEARLEDRLLNHMGATQVQSGTLGPHLDLDPLQEARLEARIEARLENDSKRIYKSSLRAELTHRLRSPVWTLNMPRQNFTRKGTPPILFTVSLWIYNIVLPL
ncbi:hypothetical protein C8Q72DRAFT_799361 [Fomitopsis betulina]|nr:hypothetical protein C8Q72DRAFT_799361 [Fomitopsis betulina]